ncbi:MAG: hypothetical protein F6J93_25335 [Oscillatoria sp. SIO1A7]|nr:hypothetical protein [Oscillatoria sp. SIO1A7]
MKDGIINCRSVPCGKGDRSISLLHLVSPKGFVCVAAPLGVRRGLAEIEMLPPTPYTLHPSYLQTQT